MRLFVIEWANGLPEMIDVIREIKKKEHQILYWSGCNLDNINKAEFSDTIFHDHFEALASRPASGVDDSIFSPPGEDLLVKLADVESTVLTMMNKKYPGLSVDERKHFYYHLVKYWSGVLKKFQPEAIIFLAIPHTVYNFVIYSLAKLFGIKTIMFDVVLMGGYRVIGLNDYKKGNSDLENGILKQEKKHQLSDLNDVVRIYYERQMNSQQDATPTYTKEYVASRSDLKLFLLRIRVLWHSIKDLSVFKKVFDFVVTEMGSNMKKEYVQLHTKPDFERPFIYLPLNYQPECTTSPMGGIFVDQLLMVETLAAAIPSDWLIYVKEHPGQWITNSKRYFNYRYRGYYKEIAGLPNVRLVPVGTSNYDLINNARIVATVTGTPGWEALLRSKPTLVFGYPWYQYCPGVFKVNDVESCKLAIENIVNGFKVEKQEVINFLYYFSKLSWSGYNDENTKKFASVDECKVKENYVKFLLAQIEQIKNNSNCNHNVQRT